MRTRNEALPAPLARLTLLLLAVSACGESATTPPAGQPGSRGSAPPVGGSGGAVGSGSGGAVGSGSGGAVGSGGVAGSGSGGAVVDAAPVSDGSVQDVPKGPITPGV